MRIASCCTGISRAPLMRRDWCSIGMRTSSTTTPPDSMRWRHSSGESSFHAGAGSGAGSGAEGRRSGAFDPPKSFEKSPMDDRWIWVGGGSDYRTLLERRFGEAHELATPRPHMINPFKKADPKPAEPSNERVMEALRSVMEPELHKDIVTLNMVKHVTVCGSAAKITVELTTPACPLKKEIEESCRKAVTAIPGIDQVNVEFTSNVTSRMGIDRPQLAGLKNVIAVTSGKGGVGKSTCTVNLAVALAKSGARVGLLDCDVYGPDIPTMLGIKDKPEGTGDRKFIPLERYGIKSMSIGYLVDEDAPVVWRGPMLHKVIEQFLKDVEWDELDYLLVDMPPGTGDAQLSLSQLVPLTGAVIVTTPQDVALVDVKKAIAMFAQVRVGVLGVVENMTGFTCSHCGHLTQIFGEGGAEKLAAKFNIPVLGRVPLDPKVRIGGDTGAPIVVSDPTSPV